MPNNNINSTVLITGSTSGIGREIAIRFAENGWNLVCHYSSSEKKTKELKCKIDKFGVDSLFLKADFLIEEQLLSFVDKISELRIDSLVNNVGTYIVKKHFSKLSLYEIIDTFKVNLFAPIILTSSIFEQMKERRFGRIVNISSIAAKYGGSSLSMHYGCSKLGLEGITKTIAREGAEYNVLVNTIRPGVIDTEFHKRFHKDNMERRISMIPMKKMGMPKDVAESAYYLGSDKNKFITNETIAISGGE